MSSVKVTIGDIQVEGKYYGPYLLVRRWNEGWYNATILSTDSNCSSTRKYQSKVFMTGLSPGSSYTLYHLTPAENYFSYVDISGSFTVYTEPNPPTSPTFSNITPNSTNINWTKNGNGSATNYRLSRGPSASGPWTTLYDGIGVYFADTGLAQNTEYFYRLASYVPGGSQHYTTTMSITTSTDPAVSAALAAQGAAEAAMLASQSANTIITNMNAELQMVRSDIEILKTSLDTDLMPPTITRFCLDLPFVTALRTDTAIFTLEAYDNKTEAANLTYRYQVNGGVFSEWSNLATGSVCINIGSDKGLKTIKAEVRDSAGRVSSNMAKIWRL